jgi:hypothetical protein
MNEQTATPGAMVGGTTGLVCRLRHRELRRGPSPVAGEVELENASPDVVEIEVRTSPLQYLNLIVLDDVGEIVSERPYGDLFSPLASSYLLRLQPGEKYTGPVHLLGNVPEGKLRPGVYTVQAVYEHNGMKAISEPLRVELPTVCGP